MSILFKVMVENKGQKKLYKQRSLPFAARIQQIIIWRT